MATSESGSHKPDRGMPAELESQISFLEDEVTDLRRRLADSPSSSRLLESRLADWPDVFGPAPS